MTETALQGSILALILFDVCEEIKLEELRHAPGTQTVEPSFKHQAPEYVRFRRPPVVEPFEIALPSSQERLQGQIKYYDYGVVSVVFEHPFTGDWPELVQQSSRWVWDTKLELYATGIASEKLERIKPALIKPYENWLSEDYFIFQIRQGSSPTTATELLQEHGDHIAQIVRGEAAALSESERNEVLQSHVSYYPNDLVVIGWNAALVYDTAAGAETAIPLLEYANSQLLEFRHYDELLTHELVDVYRFLEKGTGPLARWRLARAASRLQTVLLDVTELTERADNAIKFLSDMFSARLYRLAATKVGVPDYKNLVNGKLRTAGDLYRFMVDEFHQARAFVLELLVVIILVIELFYLFRGRIG